MFLYSRLVVFPYSVIEPYTAATATHAGQYGSSVISVFRVLNLCIQALSYF